LIARYHPMKGHAVFLEAAATLANRIQNVNFLLAGRDVIASNPNLARWINLPVLEGRLHLLGERQDIPRLTAALDIATSASSWGEAFPNTLGEAMSCAVPCIATDVGDARRILGDTGIIVPAGDSRALALAWERLLAEPKETAHAMGNAARQRVIASFALNQISTQYAALYQRLTNHKAKPEAS
jgi:glycosyltransferase involved in cell wall biosynthesis